MKNCAVEFACAIAFAVIGALSFAVLRLFGGGATLPTMLAKRVDGAIAFSVSRSYGPPG